MATPKAKTQDNKGKDLTPHNRESEDRTLRNLPDGRRPLPSVDDPNAKQIFKLAEKLVQEARKELGSNTSKPRLQQVEDLFVKHAGNPPSTPDWLDKVLRKPEHAEEIANLDMAWDKSYATALNAFDQISVSSGSKIQDAEDNWILATRVYLSEARSAGAIFKAEIEKAHTKTPLTPKDYDEGDRTEVGFYTRSSDISEALVVYEQAMATATSDLATAFGSLIKDLFDGVTSVSVGEAQLINAIQAASKTFWTGVDGELTNVK